MQPGQNGGGNDLTKSLGSPVYGGILV